MLRTLVAAAAVLAACLVAVPAPAAEPVRILFYGDSLTQGSTGDWTWRYFVARHLESLGVSFDAVGPRRGVHHLGVPGESDPPEDDGLYADPAFDSDAGAVWGQTLSLPRYDLANTTAAPDLVTDERPDVVVALIGINDLGFLHATPAELADQWQTKIAAARTVDPDIDIVLVQVPETWHEGVPEYNAALRALADDLDTPAARVVTTALPVWREAVDTYDGTHPTSSGEIQVARAVEDALAEVGVGLPAGKVPVVAAGPTRAATLTVSAGIGQATLAWSAVPGVDQQWLEERDVSAGQGWERFPIPFDGADHSWTAAGLIDGHRYEYRLRPAKGTAVSAVLTSAVVSVVPGPRPAAPRPGPVTVDPGGHASVGWAVVPDATGYVVALRDVTAGTAWRDSPIQPRPSWSGTALLNGHAYDLRVRADHGQIEGATSGLVRFTVPLLSAVTRVTARSPRRDRVRTTAAPVPYASAYRLLVASAARCRKAPAAGAFRPAGADRRTPSATVSGRSKALWVRWTAVRGGTPGRLAAVSTTCVLVR